MNQFITIKWPKGYVGQPAIIVIATLMVIFAVMGIVLATAYKSSVATTAPKSQASSFKTLPPAATSSPSVVNQSNSRTTLTVNGRPIAVPTNGTIHTAAGGASVNVNNSSSGGTTTTTVRVYSSTTSKGGS